MYCNLFIYDFKKNESFINNICIHSIFFEILFKFKENNII